MAAVERRMALHRAQQVKKRLIHYLTNLVVAVSEDDDIICNRYNMLDQYFVKKSVFSFWLNRNPEEENGVNLFLEVLIPITTRESTLMCLCQEKFDMGDILIGDKKTGICADSCSTIADLGTSLLAGPTV
ncbi:cardosin-H-like [Arachis stenosperma]|uniref:cardosin-H-like n=1 Tax=Arachis stenosperma TaxID=217475 RepID=UPI0025ACD3C2|nr:cardosin-H-like [Arachis stenosperma]